MLEPTGQHMISRVMPPPFFHGVGLSAEAGSSCSCSCGKLMLLRLLAGERSATVEPRRGVGLTIVRPDDEDDDDDDDDIDGDGECFLDAGDDGLVSGAATGVCACAGVGGGGSRDL